MIRGILESDYENLLKLYMQLHDNPFPEKSERVIYDGYSSNSYNNAISLF